MRIWSRGSASTLPCVLTVVVGLIGSCSSDPESSTIERREAPEVEAGPDANVPFLPGNPAGQDCCQRYCEALFEAGCTNQGASPEACVVRLCPVPGGLDTQAAADCRIAIADALCCSWQNLEAAGCSPRDPHGTSECGTLATTADEACTVP